MKAPKGGPDTLSGQVNNDQRIGLMYEFLHRYIQDLYKSGKFDKETLTFPKAQLY
jgi:hypothetical protein